jgi:glucosamine-phosphate N-acetyltransferase
VVVGEHLATKKIVAAATLLVERKFIHACGITGHVEDVVVSKAMRGRNLGVKLIEALKYLSKELGCYKLILDCSQVRCFSLHSFTQAQF